ncbi:MAG: energy-coupling factor transporter ATPase [Clostridia bacterium]|nr:energy-coupling factor transporter ATPase [Clostridia bacterium]
MGEILKLENVSYTYGAGTPFEKTAVKDINLTFNSGDFVAIIGHTGSGKSTLVQHFNALLPPTSGKVYINGEDINQSPATRRAARFACGLVFQYPEYQLFEETVFLDIAYGPKNMGLDEIEVKRRVLNAAEAVGIDALTLEKSPFDLSGGQKRRVAIAGIIAMEPEILVLDEPMAGLDPQGREEILEMIRNYHDRHKTTIILVTHSMEDAAKMANRIVVMCDSQVLLDGTPSEIFARHEVLTKSGLDVPQITSVLIELKNRGYDVDTSVYTIEGAKEQLMRLRGKL